LFNIVFGEADPPDLSPELLDHKTRLRDVDPFHVAQAKLAGKFSFRQGLWIEG